MRTFSCYGNPVRQQGTEAKMIKYVVPITRLIGTEKPFAAAYYFAHGLDKTMAVAGDKACMLRDRYEADERRVQGMRGGSR